jgi:hypothetical protein
MSLAHGRPQKVKQDRVTEKYRKCERIVKAAIAIRAHEIFLAHSQPGRDLDNWLAERRAYQRHHFTAAILCVNEMFIELLQI